MPSTTLITYQLSFVMDRLRQWQILNPSPQQFTFGVTQLKRVTDRKSACADQIVCLEDRNQEKNAVERKRTKQTYILNDLKIKQKGLTIHFPLKKLKPKSRSVVF